MTLPTLAPAELAARTDIPIVDIRPVAEREAGLGWIPGSVCVPPEALLDRAFAQDWPPSAPLALACLSGRRSAAFAVALTSRGWTRVHDLAGGLLAWRAEGLPVAGEDTAAFTQAAGPLSRRAVERELVSCFVAEAVLVEVERDDEGPLALDPVAVVRESLTRVGVEDHLTVRDVTRVLDRLAAAARAHGHAPGTIAANVDRLLRMAGTGEWSAR